MICSRPTFRGVVVRRTTVGAMLHSGN